VVDVPTLKTSPDTPWLDFRSPESFGGSLKVLNSVIEEALEDSYEVHILCDNIGQAERLEEVVPAAEEVPGGAAPGRGTVSIGVGSLRKGFVFPEARLKVLTDHEIFGRYRRKPRYPRFRGEGPLESYRALSAGDFVVHVNHGIGRYGGTQRLTVEGRETECLLVNYQDGDKLFVPIDQLDLLQKYNGKDGEPPSLSKLGGAAWEKIKARTKKAIREMAEELIRIYAMRKARPGHAFPSDTRWQKELEASFIYQDTPDQARATAEIKVDMESARPMDRLICGDVGYGKTEVAIRAAFKAVMDGKQVAILVPTTVLAQQHYYTFTERLAEYPLKVEMLSRFRSRSEQKKIVAELKEGKVDIVIGTQGPGPDHHRRGAALRGSPQGDLQKDEGHPGRLNSHRDTHPPHAPHGAAGGEGHVDHRHASKGPPSGGYRGRAVRRRRDRQRRTSRAGPGRPGLLRP
jgi:transcription-repair coupling factor (superfamily II helicase)